MPTEKSEQKRDTLPLPPTLGRIVHYKLMQADIDSFGSGLNGLTVGDLVPAIIARVNSPSMPDGGSLNLRLLPDGTVTPSVTSRLMGDEPGQWNWPARV